MAITPYTGWDQFDRMVDALWQYYGGTPANREEVLYGFDRANIRLWRQNTVAGTGQDEYYTYDGLFQVKTLDRGTLNGTKTGISGTPSWEEDWNFDETGNWHGTSTGYQTKVSGSTTLNQNRTHNVANEITNITETAGTAWPTPSHDGNGNLTQIPRPLSLGNSYDLKYDAWNRLVEVKNTGGATIQTYRYDGFHRRITSYDGTNTRHYYYSLWWQVLEERLNSGSSAERSFVWGLRYLDDLVLRQKSSERLYALHDYFSATAITDTSGTVLERYGYDAFGGVRYMDASFGSRSSSSYGWETLYDAYRYDSDTGLYQVRHRYLHSKLGRWEKRDPIGYGDGANLYEYVQNSPINSLDYTGLDNWNNPGAGQNAPPVSVVSPTVPPTRPPSLPTPLPTPPPKPSIPFINNPQGHNAPISSDFCFPKKCIKRHWEVAGFVSSNACVVAYLKPDTAEEQLNLAHGVALAATAKAVVGTAAKAVPGAGLATNLAGIAGGLGAEQIFRATCNSCVQWSPAY